MITPSQCRAARGLVDWSQATLAARAKVSESTVRNFEAGRADPYGRSLRKIVRALEAEGVELIADGVISASAGVGVRVRKGRRAQPSAVLEP